MLDDLRRWRDWLDDALQAVAGRRALGSRPSLAASAPAAQSLARAARQIELMAGVMERLPA